MRFGGLGRMALMTIAAIGLQSCAGSPPEEAAGLGPQSPPEFAALQGWRTDDHAAALSAFRHSCTGFARHPGDRPIVLAGFEARYADWHRLCAAAGAVPEGDPIAARQFFERHLQPVPVRGADSEHGLFTGYFAPLLHGSWNPSERFRWPLYARPPEYGRRGLPTRAEIAEGALAGRGLELVWVDDPVDAFFLEIQGSGHVALPDGSLVGVGYHGWNGHPYFAIGRALIDEGHATREEMSMDLIRNWLAENPDKAQDLMNRNESFIFFRVRETTDIQGALEVPLTPGRSLAVDRDHVPLGVPLWLDIADDPTVPEGRLQRLMMAQDTGGAIRGVVAGDVFWGFGDEAGAQASAMQARGRYFMLVPRTAAARSVAER
ncbi:MAG: murein transglycosylase [Gammaproteobacteria bacterium]|jgi:membrane-bound lytic murein transglycosylase A|nr:murein transglycosylase [Gammaproteobacteria bacterium]